MTVIPDGIDPVEAYRCWTLENGKLRSLNGGGVGETWTPGVALAAKCNNGNNGERYDWRIVRNGMSREQAQAQLKKHHDYIVGKRQALMYLSPATRWKYWPQVPSVEPPDGYGYELEITTHNAPDEGCTCGIYALADEEGVPDTGNVYGKVNLWGKVIPGEKGYRAEFAYPSEFRVAPDLADNETLRAFGVPVITDATIPAVASAGMTFVTTTSSANSSLRRKMIFTAALNVTFALLNLAMIVAHLFGWLL